MEEWTRRTKAAEAKVYGDGLMINNVPDEDGLASCRTFAEEFVKNV